MLLGDGERHLPFRNMPVIRSAGLAPLGCIGDAAWGYCASPWSVNPCDSPTQHEARCDSRIERLWQVNPGPPLGGSA